MQSHKFGVQRDVQRSQALAKKSGEFLIGGDLRVTRLGFGSMRITARSFNTIDEPKILVFVA